MAVDLAKRTGQFRTDKTGELVNFTLLPYASVLCFNAEADLSDLTPGSRCQFSLHPNEQGAFVLASGILDEYTRLATDKLTYRLDAALLDQGKLHVSWKVPPIENDKNRMEQPPDYGHCELLVDATTRVWKADQQIKLSDLAIGDELLVNSTGLTTTSQGRCTDLWVGIETHQRASSQQRAKHETRLKSNGLPGWIERIEGNKLFLILINGPRRNEFKQLFDDNFKPGQEIKFVPADPALHPTSTAQPARLIDNQNVPLVTYGNSGTRIAIQPVTPIQSLRPGGVVRILK
jgi:hypothetical protein